MTARRRVPWIKDALGLHVEPGYVIAAGMSGSSTMEHMIVQGIYLDKVDCTPYGIVRVADEEIIFKHIDDSLYTQYPTGLVDCPLLTIKGRLIHPDKILGGTKTFSVSSVTTSKSKLNNFIRTAEDITEFKESLIFL